MNEDAVDKSSPEKPDAAARQQARAGRRENAARDALRALLRDHYLDHFGARVPVSGRLNLSLTLSADPTNGWDVQFLPPFGEQIGPQLAEVQAGRDAYQRGRVYCFRCESSQCVHSAPSAPSLVFRGYNSTGVPEWFEMVQALLEAKDERAELLYADPPRVVARVQYGRDLRCRQLSCFGRSSRTYSILGQVVAGYFSVPVRWPEAALRGARLAVTFQVVETRDRAGAPCLRVNPLPGGLTMDDLDELLAAAWRPGIGRPLERAVLAVESLEGRLRAARGRKDPREMRETLRAAPRVLLELARSLEQGGRQGTRRTHHVEERRESQRPVHKALEDAREAKEDAWFFDEKKGTWVVCGRQGRAHVFSREGKHVTSFFLAPGGAAFRVRTSRWRVPTSAEAAELRALLARGVEPEAS